MPSWLTRRNLELAACCAGAAAVVLFPASLITLGLGAVLGYRGRDWLNSVHPASTPAERGGQIITSIYQQGRASI